jgi:hypothetical protein
LNAKSPCRSSTIVKRVKLSTAAVEPPVDNLSESLPEPYDNRLGGMWLIFDQ